MEDTLQSRLTAKGMDPTERFNLAFSATLKGHPYERILESVLAPLRVDHYLHGRIESLFRHDHTGITGLHSVEVGVDMGARCVELGMESYLVLEGSRAGMLHDIGKLGVPAELLTGGKLTPEQLAIVRKHPSLSGKYLDFCYSSVVWDAAHGHHEGTANSYPRREDRRKEDRPYAGQAERVSERRIRRPDNLPIVRMVQSAEVLHALLHKRSYKPAFGEAQARKEFDRIFRGDSKCMTHFESFMRMNAQKGTSTDTPQ